MMKELRTTTGQRMTINYDPKSNALIFTETDWFADPIRSTGVPVKSQIVRPLGGRNVLALLRRRAAWHSSSSVGGPLVFARPK
jgi:hypothetical protein